MANYVAHHTKKKERLARLEQQLLRSVRGGTPRDRQLRLAEGVRLARIRALRAERATFVPRSGRQPNHGAALKAKLAALEAISSEAILAEVACDDTPPR